MLDRIREGRTDLVLDHVDRGGVPTLRDERGVALIQWCAYHGDVTAIRYLLAHGESLDALGVNLDLNGAAFHGHWQLCQFLLENGADANHPLVDTGERPLHAALCKLERPGDEQVVRVLLAHGADPNVAASAGVETGAFMRDVRTRGETPLHRAAAFGTELTIEALLHAGADPQARDVNGDSPLTWASWHLRPRSVLRLLTYGPFNV